MQEELRKAIETTLDNIYQSWSNFSKKNISDINQELQEIFYTHLDAINCWIYIAYSENSLEFRNQLTEWRKQVIEKKQALINKDTPSPIQEMIEQQTGILRISLDLTLQPSQIEDRKDLLVFEKLKWLQLITEHTYIINLDPPIKQIILDNCQRLTNFYQEQWNRLSIFEKFIQLDIFILRQRPIVSTPAIIKECRELNISYANQLADNLIAMNAKYFQKMPLEQQLGRPLNDVMKNLFEDTESAKMFSAFGHLLYTARKMIFNYQAVDRRYAAQLIKLNVMRLCYVAKVGYNYGDLNSSFALMSAIEKEFSAFKEKLSSNEEILDLPKATNQFLNNFIHQHIAQGKKSRMLSKKHERTRLLFNQTVIPHFIVHRGDLYAKKEALALGSGDGTEVATKVLSFLIKCQHSVKKIPEPKDKTIQYYFFSDILKDRFLFTESQENNIMLEVSNRFKLQHELGKQSETSILNEEIAQEMEEQHYQAIKNISSSIYHLQHPEFTTLIKEFNKEFKKEFKPTIFPTRSETDAPSAIQTQPVFIPPRDTASDSVYEATPKHPQSWTVRKETILTNNQISIDFNAILSSENKTFLEILNDIDNAITKTPSSSLSEKDVKKYNKIDENYTDILVLAIQEKSIYLAGKIICPLIVAIEAIGAIPGIKRLLFSPQDLTNKLKLAKEAIQAFTKYGYYLHHLTDKLLFSDCQDQPEEITLNRIAINTNRIVKIIKKLYQQGDQNSAMLIFNKLNSYSQLYQNIQSYLSPELKLFLKNIKENATEIENYEVLADNKYDAMVPPLSRWIKNCLSALPIMESIQHGLDKNIALKTFEERENKIKSLYASLKLLEPRALFSTNKQDRNTLEQSLEEIKAYLNPDMSDEQKEFIKKEAAIIEQTIPFIEAMINQNKHIIPSILSVLHKPSSQANEKKKALKPSKYSLFRKFHRKNSDSSDKQQFFKPALS